MLDVFLDAVKRILKSRLFPITLIYILLFSVIVHRLFVLQIIQGPQIAEESDFKKTETREIPSTRGKIYDRNGVLLASNTLSYSVTMEDITEITSNKERNAIIHELIGIIERNGDTLYHDFPIRLNEQGRLEFTVSGTSLTRFKKNAYAYVLDDKKNLTDDQINATAEEVYDFLKVGTGNNYTPMFGISDEYTVEETLEIMSIRYAIFCNYPKYLKITVASNVTDRTVAEVLENSAEMPGVNIQQQTQRVYHNSIYFAHMLGYTGLINAEELELLNGESEYYNSTDIIGKVGLEKEFETQLSGKKGKETVSVANGGKVVDIVEKSDPMAGNDIYLTIDSNLQKSIYHILEKRIAGILISKLQPDMNYGSKGESASKILTPIYEVYFALINNNIIDIGHFNDPEATELEQQVLQKYQDNLDNVFGKLETLLAPENTYTNNKSGDMEEFLDYFYEVLVKQKILLTANIGEDDSVYKSYLNEKIPLSTFLQHAIANNYIDLSKLGVGSEFYTLEEHYQKLMDYMKNILAQDGIFNKKIYRNLVFSYKLSGKEISILLFDQGVLEWNEEDINGLKSGRIGAYDFMLSKLESLEITPGMLALEPSSGSVVITDVNNGDVLAMVTYPSYDNNKMANKVDPKYYNQLLNDSSLPLMNRPTQQRIAPGSTFKMVTAMAGLEESVVTTTETIRDLGIFEKITPAAKCHIHPGSHGSVDLDDALKVSCNYYFYELAYRLSIDSKGDYNIQLGLGKLKEYASLFGLDTKSGVEIPEATPLVSDEDPVRSAIGQGTNLYTPIQLARYMTTLANRGINYNLTLLDRIVDKDGATLHNNSATIYNDLTYISSRNWDSIQKGLYDVVNTNRGSVYSLYKDLGVTVAGKTGTSQISLVNYNNALFLSYAPYNNPEISVTTVIPNGNTSGNAAELTADIYRLYYNLEDPEDLTQQKAELPENNIAAFSD